MVNVKLHTVAQLILKTANKGNSCLALPKITKVAQQHLNSLNNSFVCIICTKRKACLAKNSLAQKPVKPQLVFLKTN